MELVYARFNDFDDFVWSLPPGAEFTGVELLSVLKHFAHDEVTEFQRSGTDLFVIVALNLMLVILDAQQSLISSFFYLIEGIE